MPTTLLLPPTPQVFGPSYGPIATLGTGNIDEIIKLYQFVCLILRFQCFTVHFTICVALFIHNLMRKIGMQNDRKKKNSLKNKLTQPMSSKLIFLSTIKARYPVGDKPEECDSTRENSSKHSGRGDSGASSGGGGSNGGGIICQRCQDVKRGPLKRIQVCEYCKEWKRLEALLPNQVRRKTPTEVGINKAVFFNNTDTFFKKFELLITFSLKTKKK